MILDTILEYLAVPSVVAAHWVGQKSSPVFAICRPKFTTLNKQVQE